MKKFTVYFDITVTKSVEIEADDEKEAIKLAKEKIERNPFYYASKCDSVIAVEPWEAIEF